MSTRRLLIFGASGHGSVVADAAQLAGWEVIGFADDAPARRAALPGLPEVCAVGIDEAVGVCRAQDAAFIVAIGDNAVRRSVYLRLLHAGLEPALVVHPGATIASSAVLGPGTVALAGAVVNPCTRVGADVILNTACSVDHDNEIGDHVHISPGAHLGGTVRVGEGTHLGLGASIRNNVVIGEWVVVGLGSAVVGDLPDRVVAYGVPARVRRPASRPAEPKEIA